MNLETLILAAGKGTRMKSKLPKVLHKVCGKPMLQYVIEAAKKTGSTREVVVIGSGAELVRKTFPDVEFAVQEKQLGTGHAVLSAKENFADSKGTVLILCGDTPLLTDKLLKEFTAAHEKSNCAATVLTADMPDATGYGRIIREENGAFKKIVEEKDATDDEKKAKSMRASTASTRKNFSPRWIKSVMITRKANIIYPTFCQFLGRKEIVLTSLKPNTALKLSA